jgi:hypothetical protein
MLGSLLSRGQAIDVLEAMPFARLCFWYDLHVRVLKIEQKEGT